VAQEKAVPRQPASLPGVITCVGRGHRILATSACRRTFQLAEFTLECEQEPAVDS